MASLTVLKSIAITVISIGIGFLYFYIMSPNEKQDKRKQIDEMSSLLINFIIYIWVGKIIANISIFIKDPIAVLAYPSNSNSFYIATILLIANILYKKKRENIKMIDFLLLFVPVFIAAIFVYEFIQWTVIGHKYNGLLLLFVALLLVLFTLKRNINTRFITGITLVFFTGLFVISISSSLMTLFGYILAPWYFLSLSLSLTFLIIYRHKRMV